MSLAVIVNETCKMFGKPGNPTLAKRMSRLGGRLQGYLDTYLEQQSVLALDHISFEVETNEIYGLCGPYGSGKSTIIHLLATLLLPDSGELHVFGYDVVRQASLVRQQTNKVAVDASLFKQISAIENLLYRASADGLSSAVSRHDVEILLIRLGLELEAICQPLEEMDRSQQQVVAIAARLLAYPRLLLLDEPLIGLTPDLKLKVCEVIQELRRTKGLTVLFTASTMQDACLLGDRIAILNNGKITSIEEVDCQPVIGIMKSVDTVSEANCFELPVVVQ